MLEKIIKVAGVLALGYIGLHFLGFLLGKVFLLGAIGAGAWFLYRAKQKRDARKVAGSTQFVSMYARGKEKERHWE